MGENDGEVAVMRLDEDAGVSVTGFEAKFEESFSEVLIPYVARLTESVEHLV